MTETRHALVIAPQCAQLGELEGLEDAARSLHDAITNPRLGACEAGPLTRPSLLYGPALTQAQIEEAIRGAAGRAGEAGAVLVLALIGHGIQSGGRLYFMAGESRAGAVHMGVDVGGMVTQALEAPGLKGLIALVDTCHAAGAIPDLNSLSDGNQGGRTRLSILMSCAMQEDARDLRFTRGIVRVLTKGIAGVGSYLKVSDVADAVSKDDAILGQSPVSAELHGDPLAAGRLWLARNRRHSDCGASPVLGPLAMRELGRALEPLGCGAAGTTVTGARELQALRHEVASTAESLSAERNWALRVISSLHIGFRTHDMLASWPGDPLTSERLRQALSLTCSRSGERLPDSTGSELLRDAIEHLLLHAPAQGQSPTARLAAFVAALAVSSGVASDTRELTRWAADIGASIELNDAFDELYERSCGGRARLVVSLHAAVGDEWPESLDAWLLTGNAGKEEHAPHDVFPCHPSQAGVERGLGTVLRWASEQAQVLGISFRQVEIAASTSLLLRWHPEKTVIGRRLGARYDVVLRWSGRLQPPEDLWWINEEARERLTAMSKPNVGGAPVDWLSEDDTRHIPSLRDRLTKGEFTRAVALTHRPPRLPELMEALLPYSPIVMWPGGDGQVPAEARKCVEEYWHFLPLEFCSAYRESWKQDVPGAADARLAQLRTIWHDVEWLEFCSWFERFTKDGESPT
ncbi:vWA-MoxR associated conflict system protein [Streptomyces sp. NPDC002446]